MLQLKLEVTSQIWKGSDCMEKDWFVPNCWFKIMEFSLVGQVGLSYKGQVMCKWQGLDINIRYSKDIHVYIYRLLSKF